MSFLKQQIACAWWVMTSFHETICPETPQGSSFDSLRTLPERRTRAQPSSPSGSGNALIDDFRSFVQDQFIDNQWRQKFQHVVLSTGKLNNQFSGKGLLGYGFRQLGCGHLQPVNETTAANLPDKLRVLFFQGS